MCGFPASLLTVSMTMLFIGLAVHMTRQPSFELRDWETDARVLFLSDSSSHKACIRA